MGLSVGIVGLPNVGKSTLFNALSSKQAEAANYAFCTIDPNVGVVPVPDKRFDGLVKHFQPKKIVAATVDFVDIAGLVKGASKGEGKGNAFLSHIRDADAIAHVVRCFEDENIVHVDGRVDPIADIETIETELVLKDLETVQKRLDKAQRAAKGNNALEKKAAAVCEALAAHLDEGKPAIGFDVGEGEDEQRILHDMFLITRKPSFFVCNVQEEQLGDLENDPLVGKVRALAEERGVPMTCISAAIEAEIMQLPEEERADFLESVGLEEPGLHGVIQTGYRMLNLITFFTAGDPEVHAWTIAEGTKAPQAAGKIHTDFERGFIRAEVMSVGDMLELGSEKAVKEAGKMRLEGKEYVVQDGDVVHFRFNV
ncbi:MAG: redox-regulated ATPase YchF [Sandaracinus sp.]|nr:redox-regulated ATPase YchF [Sandaracinus sp.]|tara:strand:+ start:2427 stop:3533 length:1107 start_codon:yes stop_codon:yes gene_type:complete